MFSSGLQARKFSATIPSQSPKWPFHGMASLKNDSGLLEPAVFPRYSAAKRVHSPEGDYSKEPVSGFVPCKKTKKSQVLGAFGPRIG